jgi:hypothetical protein
MYVGQQKNVGVILRVMCLEEDVFMFLSPLVSPSQQQETRPATQNRELPSLARKRIKTDTQVTINIRVALSTLCIHACMYLFLGNSAASHKGRHPMETVYVNFYSKLEISVRQT